jgi:ribosomal protein L28
MPRICPISGTKYQKVTDRSHSMQSTIRRRNPNFILVRIGNKKIKIAAKALKLLKKKKINIRSFN